ncbi:hypothetical protein DEDE109153_08780 [Deinococcus deserti]|uniref:hypothetical protein n=1 Tax=Deinococcus deserti TaxID=310783 RepID=UPI0009FC82DD|nr:hypothetical protein [Deinococcus deserti]
MLKVLPQGNPEATSLPMNSPATACTPGPRSRGSPPGIVRQIIGKDGVVILGPLTMFDKANIDKFNF